jgi:hypothetical protein
MEFKMLARVRGFFADNHGEGREDVQPAVNNRGDVLVAQGLPALAETVRMGDSWGIMSAVAAAVTAMPTTTAGHSLYNGEPATGKSYVIDSFGTIEVVVDATQQNSIAIVAMNGRVGSVAAPTDAGLTRSSMTGSAYSGLARTVAGGTVVDNGWQPHGPSTPGATALAGAIWRVVEAQAQGLYIVHPGGQFNIAALKAAATASQIRYFIRWHEVRLNVALS